MENKEVINSHQPSITEWFEAIGAKNKSKKLRLEDINKYDRLEILYETISLPYPRPERFKAIELKEKSPNFLKLFNRQANKLCAIRLVPYDHNLTKLRNRGLTLKECYTKWFLKLDVDLTKYEAEICRHEDKTLWSAIFVIKKEGIWGEIISGDAFQLTHGDTKNKTYRFSYDYKNWSWSEKNKEAMKQIKKMLACLVVTPRKKAALEKSLKAEFCNNYLAGYFETIVWTDKNINFLDYNRLLAEYFSNHFKKSNPKEDFLNGAVANKGAVRGKVKIVTEENLKNNNFKTGHILVSINTDVRYLPFMKKAAAIITDKGGILSHAAIVARELKKPCIVGTNKATQVLKDGDMVEVDANKGIVLVL